MRVLEALEAVAPPSPEEAAASARSTAGGKADTERPLRLAFRLLLLYLQVNEASDCLSTLLYTSLLGLSYHVFFFAQWGHATWIVLPPRISSQPLDMGCAGLALLKKLPVQGGSLIELHVPLEAQHTWSLFACSRRTKASTKHGPLCRLRSSRSFNLQHAPLCGCEARCLRASQAGAAGPSGIQQWRRRCRGIDEAGIRRCYTAEIYSYRLQHAPLDAARRATSQAGQLLPSLLASSGGGGGADGDRAHCMLAALLRARQDAATSREPESGGGFAPFPGPRFHLINKCAFRFTVAWIHCCSNSRDLRVKRQAAAKQAMLRSTTRV